MGRKGQGGKIKVRRRENRKGRWRWKEKGGEEREAKVFGKMR